MENENTRLRFETRPTDLLVYAAPSAVDCAVLPGHNGLDRRLAFHVTRKPGKFWNDYNDLRAIRGVCL